MEHYTGMRGYQQLRMIWVNLTEGDEATGQQTILSAVRGDHLWQRRWRRMPQCLGWSRAHLARIIYYIQGEGCGEDLVVRILADKHRDLSSDPGSHLKV